MQKDNPKIQINLKPLLSQSSKPRQAKSEIGKKIFSSEKRKSFKIETSKKKPPFFESKGGLLPTTFRSTNSIETKNSKNSLHKTHETRPKSIIPNRKDLSFMNFLTPREPVSLSIIQTKEENFSDFTTQNNMVFNKHMQVINFHEKKRLNLTERPLSLQFTKGHHQRDSLTETPFITQRGLDDDEGLLELKENSKDNQAVLLTKFSFKYFNVRIHSKESPLKVGNKKAQKVLVIFFFVKSAPIRRKWNEHYQQNQRLFFHKVPQTE